MDPSKTSPERGRGAPSGATRAARPSERGGPTEGTLPPPEWQGRDGPRSVASVALERGVHGAPVPRRSGPHAELHGLASRCRLARATRNQALERSAAGSLARALSARGTELDRASKLARRSLLLGDDPALREELSGWFSLLGEPALSAATLRPSLGTKTGAAATDLMLRIGTLLLRAGEATTAREVLERALGEAPDDPVPLERLASVAAFAPEAMEPREAARFYLEAALRHERAGARAQAFEDRTRAFEMAPESAVATDALFSALRERGRSGAADEILRAHARHAEQRAGEVHGRRVRDAISDDDLPRALAAALDAGLDRKLDPARLLAAVAQEPGTEHELDSLLARLGLFDWLAARMEAACERLVGSERAAVERALAELYSTRLGRPDRAVEALIDAAVADPADPQSLLELERHAETTGDLSPLVEVLARTLPPRPSAYSAGDRDRLKSLLALSQGPTTSAGIAFWALAGLQAALPDQAEHGGLSEELGAKVHHAEDVLATARAQLEAARGRDRIEPLTCIVSLLVERPDRAEELAPSLLELCLSLPRERRLQITAERLLVRQGRLEELEALYERLMDQADSHAERGRLSLLLSRVRRRRGDREGALAALSPLLRDPTGYSPALTAAAVLARERDDEVLFAHALLGACAGWAPPLRAMLGALSAEILLRAGDEEAARRAVDLASAADPSLARVAQVRAQVGLSTGDRWGAQAMERAMAVVVPRAASCAALAATYDRLGDPIAAMAWSQRRVALRPGDVLAARDRLERVSARGDAQQLADTLAWLLGLPQPLDELAPVIASALRQLCRLDPGRAAALCRRALDVIGPRPAVLRSTVLSVADQTGEPGLWITTAERYLAAGAPTAERAELLLDLSRRRRAAGDADGAALSLERAAREGAWGTAVLAELDVALPARSSDGEIALLSARAEALSAVAEADQLGTAQAWRELGAAYWDLAGDVASAIRAWERAANLDPERGVENFAADVLAFAGADTALEQLDELAARRDEPEVAAHVLSVAALLALQVGKPRSALVMALRALELDPRRTEMVAVAERSAGKDDVELLERLYARLAASALGRFGERAVHYRAARQMERRGALKRALLHAIRAFEAVPSQGVAFVSMARLAERVGDGREAVRAIERVAAECPRAEDRAAWLQRAALMSGGGPEELEHRVDVLLRALSVLPERETLRALGQTALELLRAAPEQREMVELRVTRALSESLRRVDGPEGARFALRGAEILLGAFDAAEAALRALERAIQCDADLDDYQLLHPWVDRLALLSRPLPERLIELSRQPMSNTGASLLSLGARIAESSSQPRPAAILWVAAAHRHPEDCDLAAQAERAARAIGDLDLLEQALEAAPAEDRLRALVAQADSARASGHPERAILALERAASLPGLPRTGQRDVGERLLKACREAGDAPRLERVLKREIEEETEETPRLARLASELAGLLASQEQGERAQALLERCLRRAPGAAALYDKLFDLLRASGDRARRMAALREFAEAHPDPAARLSFVRELADLLEESGDRVEAEARFAWIAAADPKDVRALAALERAAEGRGDHEALVTLLERHQRLITDPVERARLGRRRAGVLEKNLGRVDEAERELERLLAGGDRSVELLTSLSALYQKKGQGSKAAPLWLQLAPLEPSPERAAELTLLAGRAYLEGGDVEAARRAVASLSATRASPSVLELRVEIERHHGDATALGDALADLAEASSRSRSERAALLVEAAEVARAAGSQDRALERARAAADLDPGAPAAELLARSLEYLAGEARSHEQGQIALRRLSALRGDLTPSQRETAAFLLAEAARAGHDRARALQILERAQKVLGPSSLLSLGFAECAREERDVARALEHYDAALGGDLRGLASRGLLAWQAAELARALGDADRATSYLEIAAEHPETQERARKLSAELYSERLSAPSIQIASEPPRPASEAPGPAASRVPAGFEPVPSGGPPDAEAELREALASGDAQAGKKLLELFQDRPERLRDRLEVCRGLLSLRPGDRRALSQLYAAALADDDPVHARAVAHVLQLFEPGAPRVEPPPLEDQVEQPDEVRSLLLREVSCNAFEILALVWEGAEHLFRRDPSAYGVTGLERVPPVAPTPLAKVYSAAIRALGMGRTPLFQRRSAGALTASLALLSPPAVILSGDVRQVTPALRFQLGAMLIAATPQLALLMGSPEAQVRAVLKALSFAFGPPKSDADAVPGLADALWQSIPPRDQRRLRELCDDPDSLDHDSIMAAARMATRRAGLFVSGDLGAALRQTCLDEQLPVSVIDSPAALEDLCNENPSARSLVLLATSSEYAQTRWRPTPSRHPL